MPGIADAVGWARPSNKQVPDSPFVKESGMIKLVMSPQSTITSWGGLVNEIGAGGVLVIICVWEMVLPQLSVVSHVIE